MEKTRDIELFIVGRGPLKPSLIEEIEVIQPHRTCKAIWLGPQNTLVNLYNEAAILLCTSRY